MRDNQTTLRTRSLPTKPTPKGPPGMTDPDLIRLQNRVWELAQRVEDLAAFVAVHVPTEPLTDQPRPVADVLATHYGVCDHGRLLRDPCPDCQRRTP